LRYKPLAEKEEPEEEREKEKKKKYNQVIPPVEFENSEIEEIVE